MRRTCLCRCHQSRIADVHETATASGSAFTVTSEPDVEPHDVNCPIEAVIGFAGNCCRSAHIDILRVRAIWEDVYVPDPDAWPEVERKMRNQNKP